MIVYDAQRRPVELGESVGYGGEAIVYRVAGQATLLAKIYDPAPRPNYAGKLGWMVNYPPENPTERLEHASLAWPGGLLYDARRQLKGYWMPYIQRAVPILEVFNPRRRAEVLPQFDRRYLLRTARNLAAALSALHKSGYVAGDLNESNILVTPTALVTLIDTDSFQVSEDHEGSLIVHPCPVGKPEYTPPELQGQSLAEIVRQPDHDAFGLAVLIFQLLMDGSHPFRAQWLAPGDPPPLEVRIANGAYPYLEAPQYPIRPPKNSPGIETLHPWLVELFRRCFVDGHRDPRWRPGPDLWVRTLTDVEQSLILCSAGHYYFSHLAGCPYCALAEERAQAQKQAAQKRPASDWTASGRFAARSASKRPAWSPQPKQARAGMPAQSGSPAKAAAPAPAASHVSTGAQNSAAPVPGAGGRVASAASTQYTSQPQPGGASPRSTNPFAGWTTMFAPASGGSASGIGFSPGGGAAVYGYPRFSRGVLRGRPMISPSMLQNWARVRAYKTLSIGGAQGALVGALPGALVGLVNWTAGNPLAWTLLFSLGGAAGGLARGWAPGHKVASIINRFVGWKLFWEATGLIAGAIGGTMLGLIFIWAIVPVFLGLVLGAQIGLYVGRKLYQVGDMMGWERIWGVFSAASFGALGFGMAQILGIAFQNILGVYLNTQVLPANSGAVIWALVWMLAGGITSGLGGALSGILADFIGRFSGLVD